jgi:hypothetical protein
MTTTSPPPPGARVSRSEIHRPSVAERRASFIKTTQEQIENSAGEEKPFVARNLSMCQVEKFTALFEKYFDVDKDGFLTENDVEALNEKIFDFTGWDREDLKAKKLVEYHNDLFKCLLAEINKEVQVETHRKTEISLNNWLKMWDQNMHRALAIFHLPQWVQVMPFNLFTCIDKYGRGHVTKQNLFEFYTDFMLLDDKKGNTVADNAWSQMTGNGDFKLTLDIYSMAFSNFLFAKNSYGPGLFVLGTFEECVKMKNFKFAISEADE